MGDAENALPPSKKRAAGREISRDNPGLDDDDETSEQETGTFQKASDEVMASRRIVKVRRQQTSSTPSAPSSNPFAGIRLVSPATAPVEATDAKSDKVEEKQDANEEAKADVNKETDETKADVKEETEEAKADVNNEAQGKSSENDKESENKIDDSEAVSSVDKNNTENEPEKLESAEPEETKVEAKEDAATAKVENEIGKDAEGEKTENKDEKPNGNEVAEKSAETPSFSSFQQLSSSQNAFTGLAGTGFSGATFSFGTISKEDTGSPFGVKSDQPSFSFGSSNNGSVSLFGNSGTSAVTKSEGAAGFPSMQEVSVETGEENEKPVFTADSVLFEYLDGGWKERGKGEIKVNVCTTEVKKARLVMRSKGNYRLILNANLFPEMKLANMDKKGITFSCVNSASETSEKLATFALKFKDASIVEEFRAAVVEHKGGTPAAAASSLKTPENSPKAAEV
ncbi:PREDICTED: nuclear pore complex protein NUP50B-like isoform X1 [Ipomoea nil]|uniref:nuclear pore complex protein NUP50B-like isoform X1 n=1 Tax=Ipomoea nil TaxID=35883 RepID=UPI00090095F8|nr:PREDICTED: nuclear pore complex protein NUP50B-like isoform X1 [Ipomoea nil]XP_019195638.1 PREDICTED: nuclear pore complex protein NUP50B-like isoform X1 [Ipomoea nil]